MHVHKNVKSTKKWNTASSVLKHAEVVLKNAAKWLDKHNNNIKMKIGEDQLFLYPVPGN